MGVSAILAANQTGEAPMKFHLAINMERIDTSLDMRDVERHTLEMVQMADRGGFHIAWAAEHPDAARRRPVRLEAIGLIGANVRTARLEHLVDML